MKGRDLVIRLTDLGFNFETAILCSENGEIISVIGDNEHLSENLPDLCSIVHSIGQNLTETVGMGDYIYTIITGKNGDILIHTYKNYCLVALLKKNKENLFQPPYR